MRRLFASRGGRSVAGLFCVGVILVSVNIVAARFSAVRLDLTAEGLYTLSRATRLTLGKISEPVTLRFYYSTRLGDLLPSYGVYAARVREMLDQYVSASHGKLRREIYDPAPFSDVEDQQVVSFFSPDRERFLEYDLTRLVHSLAFPTKAVVGLMTNLPLDGDVMAMMQGRPSPPMAVIDQLRQLYDVKTVPTSVEAIPEGTDVLMVVQPQKLSDKTLFAIDQFVLGGGKALVFVDPHS